MESIVKPNELPTPKASLASFWQTPVPDILACIFLCCLPEDKLVEPSPTDAPLNISQVCRAWRDITLSIGQLWAGLQLVIQPRESSTPEHVLPTLKEWLKRSGTADLRISIKCIKVEPFKDMEKGIYFIPSNGFGKAQMTSILDQLSNNAARIKSLAFILPDDCLDPSIDFICTKLRSLDFVEFSYFRSWRKKSAGPQALDERFSDLFSDIKEFKTDSEVIFQLNGKFCPACPALMRLSLLSYSCSAERVATFLSGCPQLEEFTFSPPDTTGWGVSPVPAFKPDIPAITLPSLHTLDISATGQYMHIIGTLLDWLCLPQLKKLTLTFGEPWAYSGSQSWPNLEQFLKRSRPSLESLTLVTDWMSNEELRRSLELVPSLQRLTIRFTEDIVDMLRFPVSGETQSRAKLCPMLEFIKFNNIGDINVYAGAGVQTISQSRTSAGVFSPLTIHPIL